MAGNEMPPLLTPDDVAKALKISKTTLCRLTRDGKIPYVRIGDRCVRYPREVIEQMRRPTNGQ